MQTRSERYNENPVDRTVLSRTKKNAYLYDDINNKIGLEVVDFDNKSIDLPSIIKEEQDLNKDIIPSNFEKEIEEKKVYDINSVLAEAKKNRTEIDELEKKRKLKNDEYNILNNLNQKYITNKDKRKNEFDEEELKELINTITSNTLVQDVKDKELFSDLMATNADLDLHDIDDNTSKDLETEKDGDGHIVNSFYTKSMDLSEQDFDMSDEFTEGNSKLKTFLIIFVILIIVGIISVVVYFLLKWKSIL